MRLRAFSGLLIELLSTTVLTQSQNNLQRSGESVMHGCGWIVFLIAVAGTAVPQEVPCRKTPVSGQFGEVELWRADSAVGFSSKELRVDADGAPDSYRVDGNGLSDTCDGVVALVDGKRVTPRTDPKHWYSICRQAWRDALGTEDFSKMAIFGFLVDKQNHPLVQGDGDPLPGQAYITTTTMSVPGTPDRTQRHWVDAVKVPYVVLSGKFVSTFHVSPGDLAVVYRPKTKAIAFGVYADGGALGEASVKMHRDLKNNPLVKKKGVLRAVAGIPDPVVTLVFAGINVHGTIDAEEWNTRIRQAGEAALTEWGGLSRLKTCIQ
jgi:hypothetical protein